MEEPCLIACNFATQMPAEEVAWVSDWEWEGGGLRGGGWMEEFVAV
jgi:hypothetical protein